jgi:hypothetical protein
VYEAIPAPVQMQMHDSGCGDEYRPCRLEAYADCLRLDLMGKISDFADVS